MSTIIAAVFIAGVGGICFGGQKCSNKEERKDLQPQ